MAEVHGLDPLDAFDAPEMGAAAKSTRFADPLDAFNAPEMASPAAAQEGEAPLSKTPLAPTRYKASHAPAPAQAEAPSWAETLQNAGRSALPDVIEVGKSFGTAVTHPMETIKSFGSLAKGVGSQLAGVVGVKQDAAQKAKDEALAKAFEGQAANTYGGLLHGDTGGLRRALSAAPVSTLMDMSMIGGAPGVALKAAGMGAKLAGLAKTASVLGSAGKYASGAASLIDPVANAIRLGNAGTNVVGDVVRGVHGAVSSVPAELLKEASAAGASPISAPGLAYVRHAFLNGSPSEYKVAAQNAAKSIGQENYMGYKEKLSSLKGVQPLYDPIDAAIDAERLNVAPGGVNIGMFPEVHQALDNIQNDVDLHRSQVTQEIANNTAPAYSGVGGMDLLKKHIYSEVQKTSNPDVKKALMGVYQGAKTSLTDAYPGYRDLMGEAQESMDHVRDITQSMGAGSKSEGSAAVSKALKASQTANGKNLFDELNKIDPRLKAMLAGQATSEFGTHGLAKAIVGSGLASLVHPAAFVAPFIAGSPKLAGMVHYGAGLVGGATGLAAKASKIPYYAGRVAQELQPEAAAPVYDASDTADISSAIRSGEGTARNPASTATGPYQFTGETFVHDFKKLYPDKAAGMSDAQIKDLHGTPEGDEIQEDMGPKKTAANAEHLKSMGIPVTPGTLYLQHFFGDAGGDKVLSSSDDTPIEDVVSRGAINANPRILAGKTIGDVRHWAEQYMQAHMPKSSNASGGRIERASGGQVGVSHEHLVNQLMTRAKQAKRATDNITKPLLNAPDEAIVKALDVAQQAI